MFPSLLLNSLWHSTSPERYKGIIERGAILPEPELAEKERWGTSQGEKHYPFVRAIGGISLFDFSHFDPKSYSKKYPVSSWSYFVPGHRKWPQTIWIQIEQETIKENLITGVDLLKKWKDDQMHGHPIMPIIECAHIGALATNKFQKIFLYDSESETYTEKKIA